MRSSSVGTVSVPSFADASTAVNETCGFTESVDVLGERRCHVLSHRRGCHVFDCMCWCCVYGRSRNDGAHGRTLLRKNAVRLNNVFQDLWHKRLQDFRDVRANGRGCRIPDHRCGCTVYGRVKSTDIRSGGARYSTTGAGATHSARAAALVSSLAQNLSQRLNHVIDGADSYMAHSIRSIGDVGTLSASNEIVETQTNWLCSQCGTSRLGRLAM